MRESKVIGVWSGLSSGTQFLRVLIQISLSGGRLHAYAILRSHNGHVEVAELSGVNESNERATFSLIDYATDDPSSIPPGNAHIAITYDSTPPHLTAQYGTDIGTRGEASLYPAKLSGKLILAIPFWMHKRYRRLKCYVLRSVKYIYLFGVVGLTICASVGISPQITSIEALLLLTPLAFLFTDQVRYLLSVLALRKVGPVEFQSQSAASPSTDPVRLLAGLTSEFGEDLPLFMALAQFLVPRTKAVLRLIEASQAQLTMSEFNRMANGLGVPNHDIEPTFQALINSNCIASDEHGKLGITGLGERFLVFDTRLSQLQHGE